MTWFFMLSTTLLSLCAMHGELVSSETGNQGTLMDAEEAFYTARNFEHDFKRALVTGRTQEFFEYWNSFGDVRYGRFQEFPDKGCLQADLSFPDFIEATVAEHGNTRVFSPLGLDRACITLDVQYGAFKTSGVVLSTVCVNTSSPLFLC